MDFPVFLHFSMIFNGCSMMFHDFPWHFWRVAPRCCSDVVISSKAEASRTVVSGHTLFYTPSFTHHLCQPSLSTTIFHTPSRHFAWQAWHLVTSTFLLRGRRGTWRHPPSFHVAGVALGDIHLRFAWPAWHLWHCVAHLDGLVAGDAAAFCVAVVAVGDIHLRFPW